MRHSNTAAAALIGALLAGPLVQGEEDPPPVTSAMREAHGLAQRGDIDGAIRVLGDHLGKDPADAGGRLMLGSLLDFDGKPEEAVRLWREGAKGKPSDYYLWMAIGEIRKRQGNDGPNVSYRRGTVSVKPAGDDEPKEATYKREHLKLAVVAYRRAVETRPASSEAAAALGEVLAALGEHGEAVKVWKELSGAHPGNAAFLLGLAEAQRAAGKDAQAVKTARRALGVDPTLAPAHRLLEADHRKHKRKKQEEESARKARFYEWMPPFTTTGYTQAEYETYKLLSLAHRPDNEEASTKLRGKREDLIRKLAKQDTWASAEFLAAICWHHTDHGGLEELAFASLERRGAKAVPLLVALVKSAQSTCTIRGAGHALARMKAPQAFDLLVVLLPQDVRPVFAIDVAGALADLGDHRAVPPLVDVLAPGHKAPDAEPGEDPMMMGMGRELARGRAALALGVFDTQESREALEAGLGNPQVAVYCHAALYRLTGKAEHLEPVAKYIEADKGMAPVVLGPFLEKIDRPEARKLIERWRKKMDEVEREQGLPPD